MPISDYLRQLRAKIGHDMVMMPGVTAVVINDAGEILVHHSRDFGRWYLIGGAMEPGEEPADAMIREVFEETGLHVVPERLLSVVTEPLIQYPNGDVIRYTSVAFLCRVVGGVAHVHDDESFEVRFFAVDQLPELSENDRLRITQALNADPAAYFRRSVSSDGDL